MNIFNFFKKKERLHGADVEICNKIVRRQVVKTLQNKSMANNLVWEKMSINAEIYIDDHARKGLVSITLEAPSGFNTAMAVSKEDFLVFLSFLEEYGIAGER